MQLPPRSDSPTTAGTTHPATWEPEQLMAECDIRFQRRSGPGGQHRNKVETAVTLLHRPTGILATASERRQQGENRAVAVERLRIQLALRVRFPWQAPSELWQKRCTNGRITVGGTHPDRAALLAEALDALNQHGWQLPETADRLHCTGSQLTRLLKTESEAFLLFNHQRQERGLPRLL